MPVAFSTHPRFIDHLTGVGHPERPDRIRAIAAAVRQAGLIDSPNPFGIVPIALGDMPAAPEKLLELPLAEPAEERWLETVHTKRHIAGVRRACESSEGFIDEDTIVSHQSFEIALLAVGSVLGCCNAVIDGRASRAFAAVRPPGHHAEPSRAMGFCLFANVAIAARYLQQHHGIGRVAIVDFDVHHGNGTQQAFESDPTVLFVSLHQDPRTCYPGSGYASETGSGAGTGLTLNIPFDPGAGDAEYIEAMHAQVLPALDRFGPEFLLISAGFDAHRDDQLAQIALSEDAFGQITRLLVESADRHCGGKIVSALEGGYDLAALGRSVVQHLLGLIQ